jgi:hypothetical protein
MRKILTIVAVFVIGLGTLHYGRQLASSADQFGTTLSETEQSIAERNRLMKELNEGPVAEPQFEDISVKTSTPKEIKLPRFMTETGIVLSRGGIRSGSETGSISLNDVSKAKCIELAAKWVDNIVINGRVHDDPSTLCRASNEIQYTL